MLSRMQWHTQINYGPSNAGIGWDMFAHPASVLMDWPEKAWRDEYDPADASASN